MQNTLTLPNPNAQPCSGLSMDARQLLQTLEKKPMTIDALIRHWWPTWTTQEIQAILDELQKLQLIKWSKHKVLDRGCYMPQISVVSDVKGVSE